MSLLPARPAVMLTAASGALVPAATIVRPMITDGILKSLATSLLPSTKKSAPLMSKIKPTIKSKYSTISLSFAMGVYFYKKNDSYCTNAIKVLSFKICPVFLRDDEQATLKSADYSLLCNHFGIYNKYCQSKRILNKKIAPKMGQYYLAGTTFTKHSAEISG